MAFTVSEDLPKTAPLVLVVDDFAENIRLISMLLRPKGYEIISATNGTEALRLVQERLPDIVLLDLIMPDIDGIEICRQIKSHESTRHIPIVMVTGVAERESNVRALEAGADDYLTKPIDSVLLDARVRNCLRSKRLQDQILKYQRELERANTHLEDLVLQRTEQIVRTQHVAVFSLAKLAESRDPETGRHLERMRLYVRELALELMSWERYEAEVNEKFVEDIYLSSPLHDIGKVGIPDAILLKPGALTDLEFDIMRAHTIVGGDTLAAADEQAGKGSFLAMGKDIAYYHHERWDGRGYPFQIGGTEIPLTARITALGDVYDALRSKRPYKEPFSHEKARKIIEEGRGKHFDPDLVDAFLAREKQFIAIEETNRDTGEEMSTIQLLTNRLAGVVRREREQVC